MTFHGSGTEFLEKLTELPAEEVRRQLDHILPELLSCLSNDNESNVLPAVHALLVTCLPCVPLAEVESNILQYAMPATQQLFTKSLEGIKMRLGNDSHSYEDDIIDTLSSFLQVCSELLKCIDSVLLYIISQGNAAVADIPSVPKTLVSLILEAFRHCKESELLYGSMFSDLTGILSMVYRQCLQIQSRFFEAMTLHIHFDCSLEDDVSLLVEILQVLCQIGEQVMVLDVKSMAEQWKGFAKLVEQHLEPLKQSFDVSYPICYLALEVERNLELLTKPSFFSDQKAALKNLKTTSFILKIIVKLCEQFGSGGGFLGNCCFNLLQLLLALYRHAPAVLTHHNIDPHNINDVERYLTVAADPLLLHLVNENDFVEEYFKKSTEICTKPGDCLSFLFLTMAVMRRLIHCNNDQKSKWLDEVKDHNVVGCLLECLKFGHMELCNEVSLAIAVKSGEPTRNYDLYEGLVCHCAALMVSTNTDQFASLELILLDAVLESYFWPALLASDVWCVCARAGPADLTLDLVLYLSDIVSATAVGNNYGRLEYKHISLLLRRMFSLLGNKAKQTLVERYPFSKHTYLWKLIGISNLPKHLHKTAELSFVSTSKSCISSFFDDCSNVTAFKEMFFSLFGLSAALEYAQSTNADQYDDVFMFITRLWDFVTIDWFWNGSESSYGHGRWLPKFVEILCVCTQHLVLKMTNLQIIKVLNCLQKVGNCSSAISKLSYLKVLRGLATKVLDPSPDQNVICSLIAHIFDSLLQDSNSLVKESTLEAFEYFAHYTAHENIVAEAVGRNEIVQDLVAQHLKKEAPTPSPFQKDFCNYLIFQGSQNFTHNCLEEKIRTSSSEFEEKPSKKMRFEELSDLSNFLEDDLLNEVAESNVLNVISRICSDVEFLTSSSSFDSIPSSSQVTLKKAILDLNEFVK